MSEDTLKDLFSELPARLRHRQAQLEALTQGQLSPAQQEALQTEAETDDDLAYALALFTPFSSDEMAGVEAQIKSALTQRDPAPRLSLIDGGAPHQPVRAAIALSARRSAPRLLWGAAGLAAAAGLAFAVISTQAPELEISSPELAAYAPQDSLRLGVKVRGAALDSPQVTVLAMAAGEVRRLQTQLQGSPGDYFVQAPLGELTGRLAGQVDLAIVPGHAAERTDSELMTILGERPRARVIVQPPAYALAVISEGTLRGAEPAQTDTAATIAQVPGQLTFRLKPQTRTEGRLALHAFVARPDQAPVALTGQVRTDRGTFELTVLSGEVLQDAATATVYLLVGPAGTSVAPAEALQDLPAPWRRIVHHIVRK